MRKKVPISKVPISMEPFPSTEPSSQKRWLLYSILLGTVLHIVDTFIVNIAAPSIAHDLGANSAELILIASAYSVAYACMLSISGQLGDRYGYRKLFIGGMSGFIISSTSCALALSPIFLIVVRVLQGCSAVMVVPQVLAMINTYFSAEKRSHALALYGVVNGVVAGLAQFLGGVLLSISVEDISWRFIFLLNVPIGIVGIVLAVIFIPSASKDFLQKNTILEPPDYGGAILLAISLAAILLPSAFLSLKGITLEWWSGAGVSLVTIFGLMAHIFYRRKNYQSTIINLTALRNWTYSRSLIGAFFLFFAYGGVMILTTISLQEGLKFSPLKTGSIFCFYSMGFLIGSRIAPKLQLHLGNKRFLLGGILFALGGIDMAIHILQIALQLRLGLISIEMAGDLMFIGLGQSTIMVPLTGLGLSEIKAEIRGTAAGMWGTNQQLAISISAICTGNLYYTISAQDTPAIAMTVCYSLLAITGLLAGLWMTKISVIHARSPQVHN